MTDSLIDDVKALLNKDFGDDRILKQICRACERDEVISNYERNYVRKLAEKHLGKKPEFTQTPSIEEQSVFGVLTRLATNPMMLSCRPALGSQPSAVNCLGFCTYVERRGQNKGNLCFRVCCRGPLSHRGDCRCSLHSRNRYSDIYPQLVDQVREEVEKEAKLQTALRQARENRDGGGSRAEPKAKNDKKKNKKDDE